MSCGFNFKFESTSPVTECPECGSVINDRMAYYVSRALRGLSVAFTFTLLLFLPILAYAQGMPVKVQGTYSLIAMVAFALLTVVFIVMHKWSLIIYRITNRSLLIFTVVLLLTWVVSLALSSLKLYNMSGMMVVAIGLVLGAVLTLASFIVFKLNRDTYDYVPDES